MLTSAYGTNVAGEYTVSLVTVFTTDQPAIAFTETFTSVSESNGTVTVSVALLSTSAVDVAIDFATENGTAVDPDDYTNHSGTITWPAMTTGTSNIVVSIADDGTNDEYEAFYIKLSAPSNCVICAKWWRPCQSYTAVFTCS